MTLEIDNMTDTTILECPRIGCSGYIFLDEDGVLTCLQCGWKNYVPDTTEYLKPRNLRRKIRRYT